LLVSAHRASRLAFNSANPRHSGWIFEVGYLDAALGGAGRLWALQGLRTNVVNQPTFSAQRP